MNRVLSISLFVLVQVSSSWCYSINWQVGPTRIYTTPSQVSTLVGNGDTISIDPAVYTADVCRWTANNLMIRGVNGMAVLNAANTAYGRKGIFVMAGHHCVVENIEFCYCHDVIGNDLNWAGIRFEASGLIVRNCYFHDNDNGILDNGVSVEPILIEHCEFGHNGYGDGYSHNLYINHSDTLIFRYNYVHHAVTGHELKSRARVNHILYNRFSNEETGNASREIDLPNGGTSVVMGNIIEQGPNSTNSGILGFGLEGLTNPSPHELFLISNTVVNNRNTGTFVALQTGMDLYKSYNNIFAGPGTQETGTAALMDTMSNWRTLNVADCGFVNATGYDYHLLSTSGAINNGADAGWTGNGFNLTPVLAYHHPAGLENRELIGMIDIGAYEYGSSIGIGNKNNGKKGAILNEFRSGQLKINTAVPLDHACLAIYAISGKTVKMVTNLTGTSFSVFCHDLSPGIYLCLLTENFNCILKKKFIIVP